MSVTTSPVYIEEGARRCFACSLDWPGLSRSGKGEQDALDALERYVPRYAPVAERAGVPFPLWAPPGRGRAPNWRWAVVMRVPTRSGGADFGAPTTVLDQDGEPASPQDLERGAALLSAAWAYFDDVVAGAPAQLRKGPRGGGRDRDAVAAHVAGAEELYARKVGLKPSAPSAGRAGELANRAAILGWCRSGEAPTGSAGLKSWPARYALRRLTWHVLDHAWEIEDRAR